MQTSLFLNQRRPVRLLGPCLAAALSCIIIAQASAQSSPGANSSARKSEKPQPIMLLAANASVTTPAAAAAPPEDPTPTYLRDVLPILMGKCSRCHNQQARFVYNWLDYKTAFGDRWEIKRRVWDSWKGSYYKESMPISNSPESLAITDDERITIQKWVAAGGLRGVTPPPDGPKTKAQRIELGKRLFASICAACHQPSGQGLPNVFPPLAGSDFLNADKKRAIKVVVNGRQGEVIVNGMKFNNSMPSFPLSDSDIANVLTFVYNSFGNSGLVVEPDEVKTLRAEPPDASGPPPAQTKSQFE